jgi:hypothetical protein
MPSAVQALNRRELTLNTLNCPICVLSNRTILTLSCRHPYLALDPEETRALNAAYHQRIHRDQSNLIPRDPEAFTYVLGIRLKNNPRCCPAKRHNPLPADEETDH